MIYWLYRYVKNYLSHGIPTNENLASLKYAAIFYRRVVLFSVVWAPACIFWSEFNKYMRSFLRWFHATDNITLALQHELMRETVEKRYKYKINQARQLLHTYFTVSWRYTLKIYTFCWHDASQSRAFNLLRSYTTYTIQSGIYVYKIHYINYTNVLKCFSFANTFINFIQGFAVG